MPVTRSKSNEKESNGDTALHYAVYFYEHSHVNNLIKDGADIDSRGYNGQTPLHVAVIRQFYFAVNLLLKAGCQVNVQDQYAKTPLYYAFELKNWEIIEKLIQNGADFEHEGKINQRYLDCAAVHKESVFELMISKRLQLDTQDRNGNTILHIAVKHGLHNSCKLLLSKGANPNIINNSGKSPLHVAAYRRSVDLCELLISSGADVNIKNSKQQTPLYEALEFNLLTTAKILLSKGASINIQDVDGFSPLLVTIFRCSDSMFELLLSCASEVNFNLKHINGNSYLHSAVMYGRVSQVRILLKHCVNVNDKNDGGQTPLHIATECTRVPESIGQLLLGNGAAVNIKDKKGNVPLLSAIQTGKMRLVRIMLNKGAKTKYTDRYGRTALHLAAKQLKPVQLCRRLLVKGANVNATDKMHQTPLHLAGRSCAVHGKSLTKELLDWGASLNIKDKYGKTPIDTNSNYGSLTAIGEHIVKFETAKLPLNIEHDFNFKTYNVFQESCLEELQKMNSFKFCQNTLRDIFSKYDDPTFLSNAKLESAIKSDSVKSQFPIYASTLNLFFKKAKTRNHLMNETQDCLCIPLPTEIIRKILSYLDDTDLQNIIKTMETS